jgi:hypothetical protein
MNQYIVLYRSLYRYCCVKGDYVQMNQYIVLYFIDHSIDPVVLKETMLK